ncbi:glycerophosphodiester phosphodiesterase [Candidatus Saccharibacteria bacterium]|nr:glycerophosphodiester phosphodiesterase [Candidatus Saccharibacteria bacterium]
MPYNEAMLIIGHRGAAGLAPENTLESLRAGLEADADMLEFDVRLTSDNIPILSHDSKLHGLRVGYTSFADLKNAGEVVTLESVLNEFFGRVLLNIEYKPSAGIDTIYTLIAKKYIKRPSDWNNLLFSSFHVLPLLRLRKLSTDINLALLHSVNPFAFVTYQRKLQLAAVGWHRLHVNRLAIEIAQKSDIFSYVYTVNRPQAAKILERRGIDAVVTDYPNKLANKF